ncbi:MAG: Nif3-like dinuclear metal center hexameric protein [Bacteroidetes bacterium]|nr:MAG: Nif3-like dinuclear metal center hexameric protein [Bacteroidota bacterium]
MKIKTVTEYLESIAPKDYQENYDNSGLLTGNPDWEITQTLITLDCTEEVVDEAIENNCNLIIAHHPVIFKGLKSVTGKNYVERTIIKAIKNDIAIYAIHTNLDNAWLGVSKKMGELLGLENMKILAPKTRELCKLYTFCPKEAADKVRNALFEAGAGFIGDYSHCSYNTEGKGTFLATEGTNPYVGEIGKIHFEEEIKIEVIFPKHLQNKIVQALLENHPYEEVAYDIVLLENTHNRIGSGIIGEIAPVDEVPFLNRIKEVFQCAVIRHTRLLNKPIQQVALCGGSGSFLLPHAIAQGADIYISADFKYHEFFDAENKILIADIGHYESEQFTKHLIAEHLNKNFSNFAFRLSEINTNPINYF